MTDTERAIFAAAYVAQLQQHFAQRAAMYAADAVRAFRGLPANLRYPVLK